MAELKFGIQECSKCDYKMRCEECVYNKKDIAKIVEETRKETAKEIFGDIKKMLDIIPQVRPDYFSFDWGYLVEDVDNGLKEIAKRYGVEVE